MLYLVWCGKRHHSVVSVSHLLSSSAFLRQRSQLIKGRAIGSSPAVEGWSAWGNGRFCELSQTVTQLASIRLHA